MSRCRRCARPAASRSATASACARPAGRSSRSSSRPTASGSAFPSPTIPAPACCRWRRSPIRRPMTAPAPRCATTTSPARWCMRFKYGDRLDLAPDDGPLDGARRPRTARPTPTRCVPVPLHWRRLWARRFNQSAALAQAISRKSRRAGRCTTRSSACAPRRSRSGCRKTERADNVQGAFRVPPDGKAEVAGRRLVLVDDVLTSGATVDACARALLRAGAAQRRCAGLRPGCRRRCAPPYSAVGHAANANANDHAARRNLHHPLLPLLPRGQGAAEAQGRRLHGNRRVRRPRSGAAK